LACNSPSGTAYATFHSGSRIRYSVAGKTGTAETGVGGSDNAVFIGYAPAVHPQIAIVVVVPGGGHGSDSTGPVARAMFDRYFAVFGRKTHLLRGIDDARDGRLRG
ncbi:MAG: penicillin-binding transpeptidase domain-containing protein, partial [Firmicutes bacterium]|nr:penicillin-binding transpeptidase domain-containing protein [Bacillota bacterium]